MQYLPHGDISKAFVPPKDEEPNNKQTRKSKTPDKIFLKNQQT